MARNVEIKARVASAADFAGRAAALADGAPLRLRQDDTFFSCRHGRLKLRAFDDGTGQLIFYRRADTPAAKESFYEMAPTLAPDALRRTLALACGEAGRVSKQRTVWWAGRTRIHLDAVDGLGDFMELEVVLADGEAIDAGLREAERLMCVLGVADSQRVAGSYVDLLAERAPAA